MNSRERAIVMATMEGFPDVTLEEVMGRDQRVHIAAARRACIVGLTKALPHRSSLYIGGLINRDHSTVLHHLAKAGMRKQTPSKVAREAKGLPRGARPKLSDEAARDLVAKCRLSYLRGEFDGRMKDTARAHDLSLDTFRHLMRGRRLDQRGARI